jgi:transcriptional regulator with XRE-family HTH domain
MAKEAKYPNGLLPLMEKRGLSQADLMRQLGENKQTINKLVHGGIRLSDIWAKRLAPILGVEWSTLVCDPTMPEGPSRGYYISDPDEIAWLRIYTDQDREGRVELWETLYDNCAVLRPHGKEAI